MTTRTVAQGHRATVEDVVWKPNSATELASVGDDRGLLLWDTRAATAPALRKTDAHGTHDLHTVDWSGLREELLATGARLSPSSATAAAWASRAVQVCLLSLLFKMTAIEQKDLAFSRPCPPHVP